MQALDIGIGVDARGMELVRLPERGRFSQSHSVSAFSQGLHICHSHDAGIEDALGHFAGRPGRGQFDDAGRRISVVDGEQIRALDFRIGDKGLIGDRGPTSGRLGMGGSGASSERVGVAMGRANIGEPEVIRYWGPTAKFMSWAALIPARINSQKQKLARRITVLRFPW